MRNKSVQGLRALFAIGVVLSHGYFLEDYSQSAAIFSRLFSKTAFVCFFFMLSGFYTTKIKTDVGFLPYIKKKIKRIYPLHLITLLLLFLSNCIKHEFDFHSAKSLLSLLLNACLLQTWSFDLSIATSFNTVSWFLSSLLFCYIASYWVLKSISGAERKRKIIYVLFFALMLFKTIMAIYHPEDNTGYYYCYLFPLAGFTDFLLGMIIGHNIGRVKINENGRTVLQIAALLLIAVTVFAKFYVYRNYSRAFVTIPAVALTIIAFSQETKFSSAVFGNRVMTFIGDISFEIYLIHTLCMSLVEKAGITKMISNSVSPFAAMAFIIALCIFLAFSYRKTVALMSAVFLRKRTIGGNKNEQQTN